MSLSADLPLDLCNRWLPSSCSQDDFVARDKFYYLLFATDISAALNELVQQQPKIHYKVLTSRCLQIASATELNILTGVATDEPWELCKAPQKLPPRPELVAFDMDSTLIGEEVIDEIAREKGCYAEVAAITAAAMRGELDFEQSLQKRVACLQGLSQTHLIAVYRRLTLSPGAEVLLNQFHEWGIKTVILSGGFDFFAERIAARLHIAEFHANRLEIIQGALTGKIVPPIVNALTKAERLQQIARQAKVNIENTVAIGDGANDLLVMQKAGLGIAWHAKPAVNEKADLAISVAGLEVISWIWG